MMSSSIETEIESIYEDLLFCEMLNIIFEVHRAVKKGYLFLLDSPESSKSNLICVDRDKDVFGNCQTKIQKYSEDIECPNCKRSISTTRFAPHLEKCFGKGRQSSRIASQKISSSQIDYSLHNSLTKEDCEDDDWNEKKRKRKKKDSKSKSKKKSHISLDQYNNFSNSSNNSTPRESPVIDMLSGENRVRNTSSPLNHPPIISGKLNYSTLNNPLKFEDQKTDREKSRKSSKKRR